MTKGGSLYLAAFVFTTACAHLPASTRAPAAPKLLVVIAVDQLSADLWAEYTPHFSGGLARLSSGIVFRNGYQSHAATETCPGHSTILTGDRPARNGIVMNTWIDQSIARADKEVYCAEDERLTPPADSGATYVVSPVHLKVPTLGEIMKRAWPASRTVAVSGKDRAAIMMGGHVPDERWFYRQGAFVTDLVRRPLPASVSSANSALAQSLGRAKDPLDSPALCSAKSRTYRLADGRLVGNGRFARAAGDRSAFTDSPEFDAAVLGLAEGLVGEMHLGRRPVPDLLAIGLSATDYVGHTFGTGGQEMCLQLLSLDRDLGEFFGLLDRAGIDYAVALTADHGGLDIPQRVVGGALVDSALSAETLGSEIARKIGVDGPLLYGDYAGDIFIDRKLPPSLRTQVMDEAIAAYRRHPQVETVFTKEQVARTPLSRLPPDRWSLIERARASFDPKRSGDLIVIFKPHIAPYPASQGLASTHGTPWDYDRRVPIVFWWPGVPAVTRNDAVETIDIMPTLATMLGLRRDLISVDGKCLAAVDGNQCN
jgi:predicted AlkP superfamily pyrophosphatase or phosphodiesterase